MIGSARPPHRRVFAVRGAAALALLWSTGTLWAQVGRDFLSVEAMVGCSRIACVGTIQEMAPVTYDGPLVEVQKFGKPYRIVFDVAETLRGEPVEQIKLILSIQSTVYLDHFHRTGTGLALIAGPQRFGHQATSHMGIVEQGRPVQDQWYTFQLLTPVTVPADEDARLMAIQINRSYDDGRMFSSEFEVVRGRDVILQRARAFARRTSEVHPVATLRIPNVFAELCGTPNAYSLLLLPKCDEIEGQLNRLRQDPGLILNQIDPSLRRSVESLVIEETKKTLSDFDDSL